MGRDVGEVRDRFYKHRRVTLLLASVFIFLVLAGGSIEKINVLGHEVVFSNPDRPVKLIFVSLLYMLIKYLQYVHELGGTGFIGAFRERVRRGAPLVAMKLSRSRNGGDTGYKAEDYKLVGCRGLFTYEVLEDASQGTEGTEGKIARNHLSDRYVLGIKELWKEYVKALLDISLRTTWFGEYIVPILLVLVGFYFFFSGEPAHFLWLSP